MIELENFILEEYNKNNNEHTEVIYNLNKDQNVKKYLGNINYSIERISERKKENKYNKAFIPYYNNYPVGYISLSYINSEFQISYGILNEYRKQNLAALLLEEFSEYLLENYQDIEELILKIKEDNIGSIKVAELADYYKESNEKYSRNRR